MLRKKSYLKYWVPEERTQTKYFYSIVLILTRPQCEMTKLTALSEMTFSSCHFFIIAEGAKASFWLDPGLLKNAALSQ